MHTMALDNHSAHHTLYRRCIIWVDDIADCRHGTLWNLRTSVGCSLTYPEMAQIFVVASGELVFGGQFVHPDILSARLVAFPTSSPTLYEMR